MAAARAAMDEGGMVSIIGGEAQPALYEGFSGIESRLFRRIGECRLGVGRGVYLA